MNILTLVAKLLFDSSEYEQGLDNAEKKANSFGGKISGTLGGITKVGAAAVGAATTAFVGFTKSAVDVGASFDASMSNVAAISGATADEFDQLRDKAREMGANTQYSASEAADALSYMAMAGWKTDDMLNGITGVMNLAAAGGADLAEASDIVTDALTAFGQSADQAGRLADIMAAASSNSNTNVHLLGETFKYVAPLAGSMGYSMEDTATAIGLMANAGIKGSQSGTALRSILTRLAKPTKDSEYAMSQLGISLDDGQGHMYSFMEVMEQMRDGFRNKLVISEEELSASLQDLNEQLDAGTMTQKQYDTAVEQLTERAYGAEGAVMAEYAAMLGGQEAMSGLLAIVNATDEDFAKLSNAITNSSNTVIDLSGVLDSAGIDWTKYSDTAWGAAENLEKGIEGMTKDIEYGLTQAGSSVSDMIDYLVSEYDMSMDDAASAVDAVKTALGSTGGAAAEMAGKMTDNLAGDMRILDSAIKDAQISLADQLMPTLRLFAKTATKSIGTATTKLNEYFASDAMQEKMQRIADAIARVVDAIANNLDPILDVVIGVIDGLSTGIAFLAENFDMIVEGVKLAVAAFAGLQALNIVNTITGIVTSISSIATAAGGVGAAIGAIANPVGLVVAGIAAAAVLIVTHWDQVREFFANTWEGIKSTWGTVKEFFSNTFTAAKEGVQSAWSGTKEFFANTWESIKSGTQPLRESIGNAFTSAWENMKSAWANAPDFFKNIVQSILNVFANVPQLIRNVGNSIMDGLGDGLMDRLQSVVDKARNVAGNILGAVKSFFGIHSPSTVMREQVGRQIGTGINLGMEDTLPDISGTVDAMGGIITSVDAGVAPQGAGTGRIEQLLITLIETMQRFGVTIDGKALVGYLAPEIDRYLGDVVNNLQREGVYV